MTTDKRHLSGYRRVQRQPTPAELLFEFEREGDQARFRMELRDRGQWGVEAQILDANGALLIAHLFRDTATKDWAGVVPARQAAIEWAESERRAIDTKDSAL